MLNMTDLFHEYILLDFAPLLMAFACDDC